MQWRVCSETVQIAGTETALKITLWQRESEGFHLFLLKLQQSEILMCYLDMRALLDIRAGVKHLKHIWTKCLFFCWKH